MSSSSDLEQLVAKLERGEAVSAQRPRSHKLRALAISTSLAVLLLLSTALGLWVGRGSASDPGLTALFLGIRAYRVGVAFFAGAALAVGGVIVQGLFRNPLASPQILGTNAGADLGGKITLYATFLLFGGRPLYGISPEMLVPLGCIVGAVLSLAVVLSISSLRANPITLILTGFVLNGLFLSLGSLVSSFAQDSVELHRAMSSFALGSLSGVGAKQLMIVALLVLAGSVPTWLYAGSLDVLLSGEEEASSLGVEVARVRFWSVGWASLLTAGAVAVGGGVGFVGIIIPHAVRRFTGPLHRHLLPAAFVAGGAFLILCDALSRAIPVRTEIPLLVIVDVIGSPIFLWILYRLGHENRHA